MQGKNFNPDKLFLGLIIGTLLVKIQFNFIALGFFLIFWLYNKRYLIAWNRLNRSRIFLALFVYYLIIVFSTLFSDNFDFGLRTLDTKSPLLLYPILLCGLRWDDDMRRFTLVFLVSAVFINTLYSIVSTVIVFGFNPQNLSYFSWVLPNTSYLIANYYAMYVAFSIVILILEFRILTKAFSKLIIICLILYFSIFLAMLGSRSAIIGVLIIAILFILKKTVYEKSWSLIKGIVSVVLTLSLVGVLVIVSPYLNKRIQQIFELQNDPRYSVFKTGINIFLKNPIMGSNIGDIQDALLEEYRKAGNWEAHNNKYNLHNDWIQILSSTGITGFLIFGYFFLQLITFALKSKSIGMQSFLIFYMTISMTESILERNKGVVFFSFFMTLLFLLDSKAKRKVIDLEGDELKVLEH